VLAFTSSFQTSFNFCWWAHVNYVVQDLLLSAFTENWFGTWIRKMWTLICPERL